MIEQNLERIATALEKIAAALANPNVTGIAPGVAPTAAAETAATPAPATKPPKAAKPAKPAPVETATKSFLDDDDADAGAPVTKEDVKAALVAAQQRLEKQLGDAQKGMTAAMAVLTTTANVETLRALPDDQAVLRKVITAANAAGL